MKSWTLGRSSSKKKKEDKSSSPGRPKSMIMSMPGASSSTELITSIQASPSLSYTFKEKTSPSNSSIRGKKGDGSPISAKRYLNSAQLKDQARREDLGPIKSGITSSPSSRDPLRVKENEQQQQRAQEGGKRSRTISIPSLIKSPFQASPSTPSTAVSSSTAAILHGNTTSQQVQEQSQIQSKHHSYGHLENSTSMSESDSMASLHLPPSPSRQSLTNSSPPRTRLTSITSDIPSRKESLRSPKSSKDKVQTKLLNLEELNENQASAIASLRRLRENENFATTDALQQDHVDCMSVIDSQGSIEEVKEQGRPLEMEPAEENPPLQVPDLKSTREEPTSEQAEEITLKREQEQEEVKSKHDLVELSTNDTESPSYPYAIRKSKKEKTTSNSFPAQKVQSGSRRVEAKVNLAIVIQRHQQIAARYIISTPIPALLAFDYFASWTVERFSSMTSCIIDIFGS